MFSSSTNKEIEALLWMLIQSVSNAHTAIFLARHVHYLDDEKLEVITEGLSTALQVCAAVEKLNGPSDAVPIEVKEELNRISQISDSIKIIVSDILQNPMEKICEYKALLANISDIFRYTKIGLSGVYSNLYTEGTK